jgi:hypothetical protein
MNDVRSPIDHIPVPLRWTASAGPAVGRAPAPAGGAPATRGAGQGDTRAEAAVRAIRFTGLLRRKR